MFKKSLVIINAKCIQKHSSGVERSGATMPKLRNSLHLRYGVASKKWAAAVSCPADRATQSTRAPRASVCLNVQFYGPQ